MEYNPVTKHRQHMRSLLDHHLADALSHHFVLQIFEFHLVIFFFFQLLSHCTPLGLFDQRHPRQRLACNQSKVAELLP
jgi:hypothetical protein